MKIERLISIVMLLLQRELVSASEMATMFEVSKRTIYRDIDTLTMANIPVYSLRGSNGGIGIMPTYKVDKKLLTADDLAAIVTSLDGFEQLLTSVEIKKTVLKLKNMLGQSNQTIDHSISLDLSNWTTKNELNEKVEMIHLAIKKQHYVNLQYIDRDGNHTSRKVEPYHLLFRNRSWYLQGYSLERQDFRTFKLLRMIKLDVSSETFTARPFKMKPFVSAPNNTHFHMHEVELAADNIGYEQIAERYDSAIVKQIDEAHFLARVTLPNHEVGYRFLLNLGTHVTILKRDDFYNGFTAYLNQIHRQYF